ncbi:hypothetical protein ROHU_034013 [Labeo rohita]|uniref:Uncharacterized protein n=1 Tax=Labeo rohita TaxID=84645 RepID=A0A498L8F2_LABRO|nr:hypothetical protein ROHU_034013 [Labeo rohita]
MKSSYPEETAALPNLHLDAQASRKNIASPEDPQPYPYCRHHLQTAPQQKTPAGISASHERQHVSLVVAGATYACSTHIQSESAVDTAAVCDKEKRTCSHY